jgi:beta-xylosidase
VLDPADAAVLDGRGISEGIYAPTIRYHAGTFYLITTCSYCGGNFIVTARSRRSVVRADLAARLSTASIHRSSSTTMGARTS